MTWTWYPSAEVSLYQLVPGCLHTLSSMLMPAFFKLTRWEVLTLNIVIPTPQPFKTVPRPQAVQTPAPCRQSQAATPQSAVTALLFAVSLSATAVATTAAAAAATAAGVAATGEAQQLLVQQQQEQEQPQQQCRQRPQLHSLQQHIHPKQLQKQNHNTGRQRN